MSRSNGRFPLHLRQADNLTAKEAQKTVKRSFSLARETMDAIHEIASDNGLKDNEVLSILVERGLVIEGVILAGGKVVAEDASGNQYTLADKNMEVVQRRLNRFLQEENDGP